MYDLNQIPYDYTVEVINGFKGLDLIDRVPEELRTEIHDVVQEAVIKTIPKRKKCKKKKKKTYVKHVVIIKINTILNGNEINLWKSNFRKF